MVQKDPGRLKALALALSFVVIGIACSSSDSNLNKDHGSVAGPTVPAATPTPTPTPAPTPTPEPSTSSTGITVYVIRFGPQECKRGVGPTADGNIRVGCSQEVRVVCKDAAGSDVPPNKTNNEIEWHTPEGSSKITLPWDENPWKRWLTGVAPGHYRITAKLSLHHDEKITGELEGDIVE